MQRSTVALLFGALLMAIVVQTMARECTYRRDRSSEVRLGCRGLPEGAYFLDDSDGCDGEFLHCKNNRLTKYECSYGCVFSEEANKCVDRFTVPACHFDD